MVIGKGMRWTSCWIDAERGLGGVAVRNGFGGITFVLRTRNVTDLWRE